MCVYPRKKSIREERDPLVGEDKKDIKIGVSSKKGGSNINSKKVTKIVLLNVLVLINIVKTFPIYLC